ncbi:MAG: response regulator [Deltaproteobacteria bacterium]|nr:MAG: response regulator [Deltaproteobacteria bacterium]
MPKKEPKLLIIDDDEAIRKVLTIALKDAGYQLWTASDGESGLEIFHDKRPDIVITDLRMPGMDGISVLNEIKALDPDKEVIVITAYGDLDLATRALQLKASDFITKPISTAALEVALQRAKERLNVTRELREYTEVIEKRWMDTAEELAKTHQFQRNLIESSIDGIIGCDPDDKVIIFNRASESMLGYPKGEVVRKLTIDRFFPPGKYQELKEKLLSSDYGGRNRLTLYETSLVAISGQLIPAQFSGAVLHEGEVEIGSVAFFRDLREIRRLEQQFADQARLLHQDKMISLGRLAASVVHEINNPLAGVLNYARLMLKIMKRGPITADYQEKFGQYLSLMENETNRCSKIVSNLLAFSRKSDLEFTDIVINELIERCLMLSGHKLQLSNITLERQLPEGLPTIRGDYNQIQQCVINLVFNSIDSMPQGGRLLVATAYSAGAREVSIRVSDTGCGISKEDLPSIFEPFFSTKGEGKGLGLGLSMVDGIIDRHKGNIEVVSELGKGTTFTIKLPAAN